MSAATLIACAADRIVMGKHSFLGPIDPQILMTTPLGPRWVAAEAILEQFKRAKEECKDPTQMGAWLPMLAQYGPDLLVQCQHFRDMASSLAEEWLGNYMFRRRPDRGPRAKNVAKWLSTHSNFKSHGRHIPRSEAKKRGLYVDFLESNQEIQDAMLSAFHATTHTFTGTPAVKIIENHLGKAFVRMTQQVLVQMPQPKLPDQEDKKKV
jgi:hypothetical protein